MSARPRPPRPVYDLPADAEYRVRPVGVVRSPHTVHLGTPRQPRSGDPRTGSPRTEFPRTGSPRTEDPRPGMIVVRQGLQNLLRDLDGFSHIWVLAWLHHARGWNDTLIPPRDTERRGLFATRAPHRPNPIALSAVELLGIEKRVLHIGSHDLHEGTPVLDLKPYLAYADAIPDARGGWVDRLGVDHGPDHRDWRAGLSDRSRD